MTKHVEVWTLSKESRVVPYMTSEVEFFEYYPPPDMYVRNGKFEDMVERRYMDIIQVTKHEAIYDRLKMDSKIERSDKYIAIHPDVEEAISVNYKQEISNHICTYQDLLSKVDRFKKLPWYKRVWRALWKTL